MGGKIYNCWVKGNNFLNGLAYEYGTLTIRNSYYIGASTEWVASIVSNSYKTPDWDDTYAYYTIGQNAYLDANGNAIADIRWYNDRTSGTDLWLIGNGGETYEGNFVDDTQIGRAHV